MTDQAEARFVTGGPVPYGSRSYVTRSIDQTAFDAVRRKEYVSLIGPRQVGKTSLLQRIQAVVERQYHHAAALIDLSVLNYPEIDWPTWAAQFCGLVIEQLQPFLQAECNLDPPATGSQFKEYWTALAACIKAPSILLLLDEASAIPAHISDPFYSTIRWIYTDRTAYRPVQALRRYNFAFAGVFRPEHLIKQRHNSPFNVSRILRLPDFSGPETGQLLALLESIGQAQVSAELVSRVHLWTGGQPYLTQWMGALLTERLSEDPAADLQPDEVERLIPLIEERASDNIDNMARLSLESESLRSVIESTLGGESPGFSRAVADIEQLELYGAIRRGSDGKCEIRNRIYEGVLRRATGITRISEREREREDQIPIRILFLAANPVDTARLRQDKEMRSIDEAIREAEFSERFDLDKEPAVRVSDLQGCLLRHKPHIVHFSGHGANAGQDPAEEELDNASRSMLLTDPTGASYITLEDEGGCSHVVPPKALSDLFEILKGNIRCVVLNACYSEGQARAIAEHVDCVIGMSTAIKDKAAIQFSAAFYRALGYGEDVWTAFKLGCNQLGLQNMDEAGAPRLIATRCDPKKVFLVHRAPGK